MTVTVSADPKVVYMYKADVCRFLRSSSTPQPLNMRPFQAPDKEEIQKVYLEAHNSFIFPAFLAGLKKPYIVIPALLITQLLVMAMQSFWMGIKVLAILALSVYFSYRIKFMDHVNHSLTTDLDDIEKFYQSDNDESSFWVVEVGGRLVGFVGVKQRDTTTIELQRLTVAPQYRRRGIGEKMCRHVISFYKRKKFKKLVLECTEVHLAGKNLYMKLGFNVDECLVAPFALSAITLEHYSLSLT